MSKALDLSPETRPGGRGRVSGGHGILSWPVEGKMDLGLITARRIWCTKLKGFVKTFGSELISILQSSGIFFFTLFFAYSPHIFTHYPMYILTYSFSLHTHLLELFYESCSHNVSTLHSTECKSNTVLLYIKIQFSKTFF